MPDQSNTQSSNNSTTDGADIDQYGDQDILIGLPAEMKVLIPGMAILELNDDEEPQFTIEVPGQGGSVSAFGVAKKFKFSGTGNGTLLDAADFKGVKFFEFEDKTYIITKRGKAYNYKEVVKCSFSYVGYDGVGAAGGQ